MNGQYQGAIGGQWIGGQMALSDYGTAALLAELKRRRDLIPIEIEQKRRELAALEAALKGVA